MADIHDKIKALEEKLKGVDSDVANNLTIKIGKRDALPGGMFRPITVCSLDGGNIAHIGNLERWLPDLVGGGHFTVDVYLSSSAVAVVSGIEANITGDARQLPNLEAPETPGWVGPRRVVYPMKQSLIGSPRATPLTFGASSVQPNTNPPQGNVSGVAAPTMPHPMDTELRRLVEQQQAQMNALQAQIVEERRQGEQRIAEERRQREAERHQREMEALRVEQARALETQKKEMERLAEQIREARNAPPAQKAQSLGETLKDILPIVGPLFKSYLDTAAAREQRAEERQVEIIKSLQAKPAIDPMVKEMMEAQNANQLPLATFMQQSAQTTASLLGQMTEMVKTMAELQSGPEESPAIKVIREIGNGIQSVISASAPKVAGPRRLPKTNGAAEGAPQTPAPQPSNSGMAGLEPEAEVEDSFKPTGTLLKLKELLIAQEDPDKVAIEAIKAIPTAEFQEALQHAGGEPAALFQNLMTNAWIAANIEYANKFGEAFAKRAKLAGIIQDPSEEEGEDAAA